MRKEQSLVNAIAYLSALKISMAVNIKLYGYINLDLVTNYTSIFVMQPLN